jgi:N-acetylglucosaminyldiphosphoundecaprenol N-acetyl-beta-D-mannosaminyltransferase
MARIARASAGSGRKLPPLKVVGAAKSPVELLGVKVNPLRHAEALDAIEEFVEERLPRHVVTVNLDFLRIASSYGEFKHALNTADLAVADGMPLVWASRVAGAKLPERVAGIDLVEALCERGDREGWSVYLLGAAPGVGQAAAAEIVRRHPNLRIAGVYSPPIVAWDEDEEQRIRDRVRAAQPDVLLVALGAPKQDVWIHNNLQSLGVPVSIGVGCTFDVISGGTGRAPIWMRRLGFEWLFRLAREPGRLWKRYLLHDAPAFARLLLSAAGTRFARKNATGGAIRSRPLRGGAP